MDARHEAGHDDLYISITCVMAGLVPAIQALVEFCALVGNAPSSAPAKPNATREWWKTVLKRTSGEVVSGY
jgi:hypothetical protein